MHRFAPLWLILLAGSLPGGSIAAPAPDAAGTEFFEKKIRPILSDHCFKCHSAESEKLKGGLRLDTREGVLKGGDTGPAIVPGDPEKSLLIKAVRYADEELQMPPKNKKLSQEQIAALESWVKMGAPDPRGTEAEARPDLGKAGRHWAFQRVKPVALPDVKMKGWVSSPIDAFILAKLEQRRMRPSYQADKRTLIRRATFDLTGLPPTPGDVENFLSDSSRDAFAKVVDRLLASPQYGERWGRHWLDISRYADTKGYVFEEERRYPYAYTYRDYVVSAFNHDLPFNRFVIEQIAADALPLGEDKRPLAAMGFLTLGRRFLNNQPDIIDDRIDVVTRGIMGLTVTCARCHDHKFDPISTRDYYSLYGVFASSHEPSDQPLLGTNSLSAKYPDYLAERKKRENERKVYHEKKETEVFTRIRSQVGDYLLALHDTGSLTNAEKGEALVRARKLDPGLARKWKDRLDSAKKEGDPIFGAWLMLSGISSNEFSARAPQMVLTFIADTNQVGRIHPAVGKRLSNPPLTSLKEAADRYNQLFGAIDKEWRDMSATNSGLSALPDGNDERLRQVLYANDSPTRLSDGELRKLFDVPTAQELRRLQRKIDELDATHPGAPPRAMALADNDTPQKPHVFIRGNPNNQGVEVPRQFLEIVAGNDRKPFEKGSGRLELAEAIASPDNPLTARVLVNRVWLYHFGAPLVRTPSDFGMRSDPPTHPELLDYLAGRLVTDGWSIKKLHRLIMLSSTYQQSSQDNPLYAKSDPGNSLYWRMNRQRLDFEAMRDSLLAVAGTLDLTPGGHAVDIIQEPFSTRRTVYGFIDRQNLPGLFRTFDFASPDATSPQRYFTTVPQQALFLLNSPFVVEQARHFLQQTEAKNRVTDEERIRALYRLAYQRPPARDELEMGLRFIRSAAIVKSQPEEAPVWHYGYGDFDPESKRVRNFKPFPHFTGSAWQGGTNLPDKALGWAMLNATGGHPGDDTHAVVRRWVAPADAGLKVRGTISHGTDKGDGIRARIVSSGSGVLGEWLVHNKKVETRVDNFRVKQGETIDFIVDDNQGIDSDSFTWAPVIKLAESEMAAKNLPGEWSAESDFAGPNGAKRRPLNVWEKYAQVLLLSNEFAFVD